MEFLHYFQAAISPGNLTLIIAGVVVGIVLGALPGLSSTFACAVMLPLTFSMVPVTALLFLGAVYMGSTYGGAYAAILINTPGTPQSIATTFDGFPMAQRGDGDLALTIACFASVIGGVIGIAAFVWVAPPLAVFALKFGPAEFFWLAMFGLTVIATLCEGNLIKGLMSGFLGLLLSTIGVSVVSGDARFTFETTALLAGIHIIPGTIGLLCVPVIIDLVATRQRHLDMPTTGKGFRLAESLRLSWHRKFNFVRSSVIGVLVGILPAAGGAIASLVSYSEAYRSSPEKESFGKGNPDGVIASESANNATVASGLIPTFVLGIPGTPPDAVILGAMLVHGVQIGPRLFTNHADVVYTFVSGLLIATLLMLPIGLVMGRYIYRFLLRVPKTFLVPMITLMTLIGAFAIRNNYFDIVIMLALGILAWSIGRFGFPAAPIVLGLLLGPIAEQGFSQALIIGNAKNDVFGIFFGRPVSMIIIGFIVATLFLPGLLNRLSQRRAVAHA